MLATFNLRQLMGSTPAPLWQKEGNRIFEAAKRDYGITQSAARMLDDSWGQLSLDVRGSNRAAVLQYLNFIGACSVTLQKLDCDLYLAGETADVRELVKQHWADFATTDIEPDDIVLRFQEFVMLIFAHKPKERVIDDPESEYGLDGQYRGRRDIRDAAFIEVQEQQQLAEDESRRAARDDFWESE